MLVTSDTICYVVRGGKVKELSYREVVNLGAHFYTTKAEAESALKKAHAVKVGVWSMYEGDAPGSVVVLCEENGVELTLSKEPGSSSVEVRDVFTYTLFGGEEKTCKKE